MVAAVISTWRRSRSLAPAASWRARAALARASHLAYSSDEFAPARYRAARSRDPRRWPGRRRRRRHTRPTACDRRRGGKTRRRGRSRWSVADRIGPDLFLSPTKQRTARCASASAPWTSRAWPRNYRKLKLPRSRRSRAAVGRIRNAAAARRGSGEEIRQLSRGRPAVARYPSRRILCPSWAKRLRQDDAVAHARRLRDAGRRPYPARGPRHCAGLAA